MTTLENRPNSALLVLDAQNRVLEGTHERDAVVANIGSLVERARQERVPVVWAQHSDEQLARGSNEWRIVPELAPGDAEPLVEKHYADAFEDTTLYWSYHKAPGRTAGTAETKAVDFGGTS
jgi:nicotinamidase-related amidase